MTDKELVDYLKVHYPDAKNKILADKLKIPMWKLKTLASEHKIRKSDQYWEQQHQELMQAKEKKYLAGIPKLSPTELQTNIITGSLLGDGTLSFAPRSRNAYYREHFAEEQLEYRLWKRDTLDNLGFKIMKVCHLRGPSHPFFTELYHLFYRNGEKSLTTENLQLLSHPVGLAYLFLDDGSLVVNYRSNKNSFYLFPRITLYTMSFSEAENILLAQHLKNTFGVEFNIKKVPYGKGFCLDTGKGKNVFKFLELVRPTVNEIPSMSYKVDLERNIARKLEELRHTHGANITVNIRDITQESNLYQPSEEERIIALKTTGYTDKRITETLNRNYWGIVDKIRRLREQRRL